MFIDPCHVSTRSLLDAMLGIALALVVVTTLRVGAGSAARYCTQLSTVNHDLDYAHNCLQLALSGHCVDGVDQSTGEELAWHSTGAGHL